MSKRRRYSVEFKRGAVEQTRLIVLISVVGNTFSGINLYLLWNGQQTNVAI